MKLSKRKRELLDICARLFHNYGYSGATMKILASGAGLEPASFYSHFKGKEEILETISIITLEDLDDRLNELYASPNRIDLDGLFDFLLGYVQDKPYYWAVLCRNNSYLDSESTVFDDYRRFNSKLLDILHSEIRSWNSKQFDSTVTLKLLSNTLLTIADLAYNDDEIENASKIIKEVFLNGLKQ